MFILYNGNNFVKNILVLNICTCICTMSEFNKVCVGKSVSETYYGEKAKYLNASRITLNYNYLIVSFWTCCVSNKII